MFPFESWLYWLPEIQSHGDLPFHIAYGGVFGFVIHSIVLIIMVEIASIMQGWPIGKSILFEAEE